MIDRTTFTGPFLISAGSLVLVGGALLVGGYTFIRTVVASANGDADPSQLVSTWLERHDEKMDLYQSRFDSRSVFYTPPPTPVPPPPPPPRRDVEESTPPPPPPPREDPIPATYGGPQLLAILGEEIWIRGSSSNSIVRVQQGEEQEGVMLIETIPPWTAKLGWSRGTYEVALFGKSVPGLSSSAPATATASIPGIYNEGDIDPSSITRGIALSPASFTSTRGSTSFSGGSSGRNVARPAGAGGRGDRETTRGTRGNRGGQTGGAELGGTNGREGGGDAGNGDRSSSAARDNATRGENNTNEPAKTQLDKEEYLREQERIKRESAGGG